MPFSLILVLESVITMMIRLLFTFRKLASLPQLFRASLALAFLFGFLSCASPREPDDVASTDFCSNIHRSDSTHLSTELSLLSDSTTNKTGVYVLEDGGGAMIARAWLSEYAEETIDIQYFIFSLDNIGLIACDYIVRAADRGVKVRILVDDIMVDAELEDVLTLNTHPNIEIKIYNPGVNLGKNIFQKAKKFLTDFQSANKRMHNKTFIVDDKVLITGGRNIADEYFDYNHEYNFRDRDVLLVGNAVPKASSSFNEFWDSKLSKPVSNLCSKPIKAATENTFKKLHEYACDPENFWPEVRREIQQFPSSFNFIKKSNQFVWADSVLFISDKPGKNESKSGLTGGGTTTNALIKLIKNAQYGICIQTPYLITTELGKSLFKRTISRDVKIQILTNSLASTDNLEAFSAYQSDRNKLLKTGVEVYEFRPDAKSKTRLMTGRLQKKLDFKPTFGLHAKTMVIDSSITVIGTFNLDPRSANLNTECIAIIYSNKIAQNTLAIMKEELRPENSWKVSTTFNPDSVVSNWKRFNTFTRKVIPKNIL